MAMKNYETFFELKIIFDSVLKTYNQILSPRNSEIFQRRFY